MAMHKVMVSVSDDMLKALEAERKARKLETVPEAIRSVLGEYFKMKELKGN
jgi:metal-responsive CopG/Arc/MetJ family transcriptional regulator